jgi:hypothetical protein
MDPNTALIVASGGARCGTAWVEPEKSGPPPQRGYTSEAW